MLRIYIYIYIGQQTKERKRGEQRCITLHSVIRHSILDSQLHTYNAFWITVERDSEPSPWPNGLTVNYRKNTKVVWKIWRRKKKGKQTKTLACHRRNRRAKMRVYRKMEMKLLSARQVLIRKNARDAPIRPSFIAQTAWLLFASLCLSFFVLLFSLLFSFDAFRFVVALHVYTLRAWTSLNKRLVYYLFMGLYERLSSPRPPSPTRLAGVLAVVASRSHVHSTHLAPGLMAASCRLYTYRAI